MEYLALLIPYAGMVLGGVIAYTAIMSGHKQKMAMIEAGMNPVKEEKKAEMVGKKYSRLRTALLFVFVPMGILLGQLFFEDMGMRRSIASLILAFLFGGIAMAVAWYVHRKDPEPNLDDDTDESLPV
jgi:positive regulator of sigma E activity